MLLSCLAQIVLDTSREGSFGLGNCQIFAQTETEIFCRFLDLDRNEERDNKSREIELIFGTLFATVIP